MEERNETKPNQTKPNQTKPNETRESRWGCIFTSTGMNSPLSFVLFSLSSSQVSGEVLVFQETAVTFQ